MEKQKTQKNRYIILVVAVLVILTLSILICFRSEKNEFSSTRWNEIGNQFIIETQNADGTEAYAGLNERGKMVKDLINRNILVGLTKEEVVNQLGSVELQKDSNVWSYWIGHGFGINQKYLDIYFENEIVVNVETHES